MSININKTIHKEEVILEVKSLKKYYYLENSFFSKRKSVVKAVDKVSFLIKKGETLGLVGESGCGKTTLARSVLRLIEPTKGDIYFNGRNILEYNNSEMRKLRREMQIIFQDPFNSLNPRMRIEKIIGEPFEVFNIVKGQEKTERILELLKVVGLDPIYHRRYPHEFSGGQRQRVMIAKAIALNPKMIVCDEPVSALDVSVQAQILNLLMDLQDRLGITYLFIAHNMAVIKHISNRIGVMYLGHLVELAKKEDLFKHNLHPYTQALMKSVPKPNPRLKKIDLPVLQGDVPNPIDIPSGCCFHTRCPMATSRCKEVAPKLKEVSKEHFVACHLV